MHLNTTDQPSFSPASLFLRLPRELRDIIYRYYLEEEDGYAFDYPSGKLRTLNNQSIDLALMYTCRSVAAEMSGKALRINQVTFRTVYSESERLTAGLFHLLLHEIEKALERPIEQLSGARSLSRFEITKDMENKITQKFPQYAWLFQQRFKNRMGTYFVDNPWGEAHSVHRAFVEYILQMLSTQYPDFLKTYIDGDRYTTQRNFFRSPSLFLSRDPWLIPSEEKLAELEEGIYYQPDEGPTERDFWERIKYRYSAAAAAISFLKSISPQTRLQLRKVLIHEDKEAVAYPECHALGLIPYCLENPHLRIERRLNIWRNVLPKASVVPLHWAVYPDDHVSDVATSRIDGYFARICDGFGVWIAEALILGDAGMPTDSFALVFDGDPAPDQSSKVFEIIKVATAWQIACNKVHPYWRSPHSSRIDRAIGDYIPNNFPQVIQNIIEGSSIIRCNFPVGDPPDVYVQPILNRSHGWTFRDWFSECNELLIRTHIYPSSPLPSWRELRLEHVLPSN